MAFPDVRKSLGELGEDAYINAPILYNNEAGEKIKSFKENFEKKYNSPVNHYAANGYDAIKLIEQTIKSSGDSRESLREGLAKLESFTGVLGDVEINGRDIGFSLYPAKIENGEVIYLK